MKTFEKRKRAQKLVYLMNVFGIPFPFRFSWYLHGPYSPQLTQVLYDMMQAGRFLEKGNYPPNKKDTKKLGLLKIFLGDDLLSADALELLVSIHFILSICRSEKVPDIEALRLLKERKPFFSDLEVSRCYTKVCAIMQE